MDRQELTNNTRLGNQKNLALTGSTYYFFTYVVMGSFGIYLNVYLADLGLSGQMIGWLAILSPLMMILLSTSIASFADRKRRRVLINQICLTGMAVATFLLQFQHDVIGIALFMLMIAIFNSPTSAIADSLIARVAQRNKLNYGGMRLWGSFGFVVSSLLFGALWQRFGFRPMFTTAALLYIPAVLIAGRLEEGEVIESGEHRPFSELFRHYGLMLLLVATFFAGISNSLTMIFNGIFAHSLGGGNLLIGMMAGLGALGELPMMYYSDRIGSRLRVINTIMLSCVIMAAGFLGFGLSTSPGLLPAFNFVKCIGYGLWFPLTIRLFTENTPPEWSASAQSLLAISMFGVSQLAAGPIGGAIYDYAGPNAVYFFGIGCLAVSIIILGLATRVRRPLIPTI